jgi:hypothetical protein
VKPDSFLYYLITYANKYHFKVVKKGCILLLCLALWV